MLPKGKLVRIWDYLCSGFGVLFRKRGISSCDYLLQVCLYSQNMVRDSCLAKESRAMFSSQSVPANPLCPELLRGEGFL